ncbi:MAG TPA: ATP-dependent DNA helicase RecG [Saprospiraceae bacterium]|nr:ATP-dependent DNA helicase RecG [Saprospiraceae bacterium]
MSKLLNTPIEYLKGVGPAKAKALRKDLNINTFGDLVEHFPFRYIDKTVILPINRISDAHSEVQIKGKLMRFSHEGTGRAKRLKATIHDGTGSIELIWFQGASWMQNWLEQGKTYLVYGKLQKFRNRYSIPHPEIEAVPSLTQATPLSSLAPMYPSTDSLRKKGLDAKGLRRLTKALIEQIQPTDIPETLPQYLLDKTKLISRFDAIKKIHFPASTTEKNQALNRLKFEELFFAQLRAVHRKFKNYREIPGYRFDVIGDKFNQYYNDILTFDLTGAQKRVLKEIRADLKKGRHMNRLLQGDVGSGKTVVALMSILMAIDNGYQACMIAPTEILAMQHFTGIEEDAKKLGLQIAFLAGSVKGKKRAKILEALSLGQIDILIGTHAVLEEPVVFKNLGLAITDEQHRFGVEQRSKLWRKSKPNPPHILVMTATPIPRTLSMAFYGDLDVSKIDEMPPGRQPVETIHFSESKRLRAYGIMKEEIAKGRQVYVVFPMIEENEDLDLQNLQRGFDLLSNEFPRPQYDISVVHGKMKAKDKDYEMQRFVERKTQIMVATTVIEVGVNVPNATLMIIENANRFGLSQLHQLRGRVGRGGGHSMCILMTGYKLSKEAKIRIKTMTETNDGFVIAEADLKLRGPGDMEGTRQSGDLNLKLASLVEDEKILAFARKLAILIIEKDPQLILNENALLRKHIQTIGRKAQGWSHIS